MKTASKDVRMIAVRAYQSGLSRQQVAGIVGYHLNSVSRWLREYEREGRLEANPRGHRISVFAEEERQELIELVTKNVDLTLEEIRAHFGKQCSLVAIHKILMSLGFVFKKNFKGKRTRARGHRTKQA